MNCGQCVHFDTSGYKHWGRCLAPLPGWVECQEIGFGTVWAVEGKIGNYANECDLFSLHPDGDLKETGL